MRSGTMTYATRARAGTPSEEKRARITAASSGASENKAGDRSPSHSLPWHDTRGTNARAGTPSAEKHDRITVASSGASENKAGDRRPSWLDMLGTDVAIKEQSPRHQVQNGNLVLATMNQYSAGSPSACTFMCVEAAMKLLGTAAAGARHEITGPWIDSIIRVGSSYIGDAHADVESVLELERYQNRIHVSSHNQYVLEDMSKMSREIMSEHKKKRDALCGPDRPHVSSVVTAAIILKPPETIMMFLISEPGSLRVHIFDSHSRPDQEIKQGHVLVFHDDISLAKHLRSLFPPVELFDNEGYFGMQLDVMNAIEVVTLSWVDGASLPTVDEDLRFANEMLRKEVQKQKGDCQELRNEINRRAVEERTQRSQHAGEILVLNEKVSKLEFKQQSMVNERAAEATVFREEKLKTQERLDELRSDLERVKNDFDQKFLKLQTERDPLTGQFASELQMMQDKWALEKGSIYSECQQALRSMQLENLKMHRRLDRNLAEFESQRLKNYKLEKTVENLNAEASNQRERLRLLLSYFYNRCSEKEWDLIVKDMDLK